jgi:hypothetical protein
MWKEFDCQCGLGETHKRYERKDGAFVCRDHDETGEILHDRWIGSGSGFHELIRPHKEAKSAMRTIDKRFPLCIT